MCDVCYPSFSSIWLTPPSSQRKQNVLQYSLKLHERLADCQEFALETAEVKMLAHVLKCGTIRKHAVGNLKMKTWSLFYYQCLGNGFSQTIWTIQSTKTGWSSWLSCHYSRQTSFCRSLSREHVGTVLYFPQQTLAQSFADASINSVEHVGSVARMITNSSNDVQTTMRRKKKISL